MVLAIGVALVAALVLRQSSTRTIGLQLTIVAVVALGARLVAVAVIYFIATRTHPEGTWLYDEASFYHATEALMPNPFDGVLPEGLGHLGGDTYLGVTTAIAVADGRTAIYLDTLPFRFLNATLGTLVAVMIAVIAGRTVNAKSPALIAGLGVAVWPTLILWSSTFLRDTFASFVVVCIWWALVMYRRVWNARWLCVVALGVLMIAAVRPYLAGATVLGLAAWALYPFLVNAPRRMVALVGAAVVVVGGGLAVQQARHIDQAAHELVYRQMTTRMETMGRLYSDVKPDTPPQEPPFGPGAAVALVEPGSDWILPGLIQLPEGPGLVTVGFVDGSIRTERIADLTLLQSAPLSPLQVLASFGPGVVTFVVGSSGGTDPNSMAWVADALAWDALLIAAVVGGIRARVPVRDWLFPACIILGTIAALVAVPGAPGNDDRHRASQAVPLLAVFAAGWLASWRQSRANAGRPVTIATRSPIRP